MQTTELQKLLKLTAIELEPEQMPVFLEYFTGMKQMFDEFYDFSLSANNSAEQGGEQEESYIQCFTQEEQFINGAGILANVEQKRLVGNAIEVKSAFGE